MGLGRGRYREEGGGVWPPPPHCWDGRCPGPRSPGTKVPGTFSAAEGDETQSHSGLACPVGWGQHPLSPPALGLCGGPRHPHRQRKCLGKSSLKLARKSSMAWKRAVMPRCSNKGWGGSGLAHHTSAPWLLGCPRWLRLACGWGARRVSMGGRVCGGESDAMNRCWHSVVLPLLPTGTPLNLPSGQQALSC